jgi:hypothetical protein
VEADGGGDDCESIWRRQRNWRRVGEHVQHTVDVDFSTRCSAFSL